jgi:HD superfamily phosphohydrolase
MGQEENPLRKFLADIISGPVDADKLDYVFRDGYVAGIPVGYDLERLTSTVCVDPQRNDVTGIVWWRLTLPIKGINALEQLVMGRLVLNSYLYHHQKCRAAETAFERTLAREYIRSRTVLGLSNVWDLFDLQDGDVLAFSKHRSSTSVEIDDLLHRHLRVRIVEFRFRDLRRAGEASSLEFNRLLDLGRPRDWPSYRELVRLEDRIARMAGLPHGSVILDIPKQPDYADLENLLLPGRTAAEQESPTKVLNYRDWIAAYKVHRAWVRVFGPRDRSSEARVWKAAARLFASKSMVLPASARVHH